jgi:transcriptional regulator with XRE-family HTH domain
MTVHVMPNVRGQVAAEVRAEMGRNRTTISELPRLIGKSQSYWSRRINGEVALDVEDLAALATLMEVPVSKFWEAVASTSSEPTPP